MKVISMFAVMKVLGTHLVKCVGSASSEKEAKELAKNETYNHFGTYVYPYPNKDAYTVGHEYRRIKDYEA